MYWSSLHEDFCRGAVCLLPPLLPAMAASPRVLGVLQQVGAGLVDEGVGMG